ncbi:YfcL family protein [Alteromonadaceae bacterium BrNp21-10]|nr:YfcL family protein [Alteromonadaceae bacterium BrNp21-10]
MTLNYQPASPSTTEFDELADRIQQQFDDAVVSGTDQELFYAGYLNGHFSLVFSVALKEGNLTLDALDKGMLLGLQQAFANNELEEADQQGVVAYWQQVVATVA